MINKTQYVSSDEFLEKEMKKKYYYVLSTNTYRQCSKTNLQVRVLIQITVGKCQIQVQSLDSTAQVKREGEKRVQVKYNIKEDLS